MNLMKTIRKSFSARLSLQVVMIASMVFGARRQRAMRGANFPAPFTR